MNKLNQILYKNHLLKLIANQIYLYGLNLLHILLNLSPPILRNFIYRLLIKKAGKHIFFDYGVYIKFPWLIEIGNQVSINRGVEFYPDYFHKHRIVIGSDVRIAPHVCFYASGHETASLEYLHTGGPIHVGNHVWIGAGAMILPGVTIGDNSIIGAGSVVNRDIPANSVAAGVPAKILKERNFN